MLRNFTFNALVLVLGTFVITACGDDEDGNNGNNIFQSNSTTVNNMSTSNNMTTNVSTPNNMTTPNNMSTSNNGNNSTECVELNPAIEGECDALCQSGCAGSQACVLESMTITEPEEQTTYSATCVEAGTGGYDTACTADSDCRAGFGCMEPPGGGATVCLEYCRTSALAEPQCDPGFECIPFRYEIRVGVCQPEHEGCTIFPNSCDEGEICYQSQVDGSRECALPGEIRRDDPCDNERSCEEGARCVDVGGGTTLCKLICDPNDDEGNPDSTCLDGEFCITQSDEDGNDLSWGACY